MGFLKNKTLKSAAWYTVSNVTAKAITLLITPVFARLLTKAEYGEYTNFVSWQNIFVTIFSLELCSTVLRAKFDRENEDDFNSYVFTVAWFSVAVTAVLGVLLVLVNKLEWVNKIIGIDQVFIWLLVAIVVFSPILQIYQSQQRAEVKYKTSSIITLLFGIFTFVLPYTLVKIRGDNLSSLIMGISVNSLIWGLGLLIFISTRKRSKINTADIRYALVFALPIVPHLISNIIMGNSDKIMIRNMCGPEFAAMYGLVYTTALAINLLRNSLNNAWIPWFYKKMNDKDYTNIREVSKTYIIIFSLGSLMICLLGPEMVMVLGGAKYQESLLLVPIIMLGCYYNFLNLFYVNIEFYAKKTAMISVVTACTALLNLGLNYVCILRFGYSAAAYTTAFCNFCIVLSHYLITRKMNNKSICNNKLIFGLTAISFLLIFACVLLYQILIVRIIVIAAVTAFSVYYVLNVKKKGLLKL